MPDTVRFDRTAGELYSPDFLRNECLCILWEKTCELLKKKNGSTYLNTSYKVWHLKNQERAESQEANQENIDSALISLMDTKPNLSYKNGSVGSISLCCP